MERLQDYFRALADLLFPRACLVCGSRLGIHERHLCLSCAADVPYTHFWRQSHNPMADRFNAVLERHRGTERMAYAYAAALMYYKGPYRSIPRALKYHGDLSAGQFYGALLGRRLASAPHFADVDLVIPVPLHWSRRWSRGYNQAEVLARALAEALSSTGRSSPPSVGGLVAAGRAAGLVSAHDTGLLSGPGTVCRTDLLVRARRTRTQPRLSVEETARNVASAFRVPERSGTMDRLRRWAIRVIGNMLHIPRDPFDWESPCTVLSSARHIVLVDDTFTTGATLYACYAALRPYTSARISIATLAVVEGTPSGIEGSPSTGP